MAIHSSILAEKNLVDRGAWQATVCQIIKGRTTETEETEATTETEATETDEPTRLLCPWDFSGKNTGVGCHFLLQGILLTQGSNLHLLHWQEDSLPLRPLRSPCF